MMHTLYSHFPSRAIFVATAIFALMSSAPLLAQQSRDDDMSNEGREGQALGQQLIRTAPQTTVSAGGERGAGTIHIAGQDDIPVNQFVPGADPAKAKALSNLKDASQQTLNAAVDAKKREMSQDPTAPSAAYRAIVNQHRDYSSALANDPTVWAQSSQLLAPAALAQVQKEFADCSATTTYSAGANKTAGVVHQVSCEEMHALSDASIERTVAVATKQLTLLDQTYQVTQDQDVHFVVSDGTAKITDASVTLEWSGAAASVTFTDYPTSFNNWAGTLHIMADPTRLQCRTGGGMTCANGDPGCVCAEGVTIHVSADVGELQETILGSPANPLMASDGFCTAQWTCSDATTHSINGTTITASMVTPLYPSGPSNSPNSSMSPSVCWKADAIYQCPFNVGSFGCWQTPSGQTQCHTNTAANTTATPGTTCAALQNNPACRLQFSQCAENASGFEDFCYVTTKVYNCPVAVPIGDISSTTHFNCSGSIRCAGEDCIDNSNQETNSGFTEVQGRLAAVQHMLSDTTADTSGVTPVTHPGGEKTLSAAPLSPSQSHAAQQRSVASPSRGNRSNGVADASSTVRLFPGQAFECRKALGSTIDCCSETQSGGEKTWMDAYKNRERQGNGQIASDMATAEGDPQRGAWADYADSKNWTLATRAKAMTSRPETVSEDQPYGTLPSTGRSADVSLSAVMKDYRASQSNNSGLRNDWMCTSAELDLATQREAGACANIGSYCSNSVLGACIEKRDVYCCFNSPMSLAIRLAQIGGQQGVAIGGFGTPKSPMCAPVGTDVVSSQILTNTSTDDWVGRLQQTGDLPTLSNLIARTSATRLTGSASSLNSAGGNRPDVIQRTLARVQSISVDAAKRTMENEAIAATPAPQAEPAVAGSVSFAPAFNQTHAGMVAHVSVQRQGSLGAVSVAYATADDSAIAGTDYVATSGTLTWLDGETGDKTFVVKTMATTPVVAGTATLQFRVLLTNPAGGVTLYPNDTGEVVLNLNTPVPTAPTANSPHLSINKVLKSQVLDTSGGVTLTYLLTATNDGTAPLSAVDITDDFPQGSVIKQWGDTSDITWQQYCAGYGNGSGWTQSQAPQGWCAGNTVLPQGSVIRVLAIAYMGSPGATVTNVCSATYLPQSAGSTVWFGTDPASCVVTSPITNPLTPAQLCESRGGMETGFPIGPIQAWGTDLGASAGGAGLFTDNLYGQTQTDIAISVAGVPLATSITLVLQPFGTPSVTAFYARISPCAGDLSLPTNDRRDPFSMQGCTTVDVTSGAVALRHSVSVEFSNSFPSDEGTCRLSPGQTYYLNTTAVDPSSGVITTANGTCPLGQLCVLLINGN